MNGPTQAQLSGESGAPMGFFVEMRGNNALDFSA
jgi:hypothetical protein